MYHSLQQNKQLLAGVIGLIILLAIGSYVLLGGGNEENDDTPTQRADVTRTPNNEWEPVVQEFDGVPMVLVPRGCFMMGSEDGNGDEEPVHEICFEEPFWLDQYEVSNGQFAEFGGEAGRASYWTDLNLPRESITWYEAVSFCEKRGMRLPTEAEWEYAARSPDALIYPWGNEFVADNVVYGANADGQTAPIGSQAGGVSWVDAYDLSGNVLEWTSTVYMDYPYSADDGREDSDSVNNRVSRGGSWRNNDVNYVSSAIRYYGLPDVNNYSLGLRCAASYNAES